MNTTTFSAAAAALALCLMGGSAARAETISITQTVDGTGTFDGQAFTEQTITIVGTGNGAVYNYLATIAPHHLPDWRIPLQTVTVSGSLDDSTPFSATVTNSVFAFDNTKGDTAGISAGGADLVDLTPADNAFSTYALNADLSDSGPFVGDLPNAYPTTGGVFSLTSAGAVTFDATVTDIPEPAAWTLMLVGAGALGGCLRSRRGALRSPV